MGMKRDPRMGLLFALFVGASCAGTRVPDTGDAAAGVDQTRPDSASAQPDSAALPEAGKGAEAGADAPLAPELCDGKDNNGNGKVDEGTFLPQPWDGATFAPKGYFGTTADHHFVVSGRYLFILDLDPAKVVKAVEITSADPKVNALYKGVSPPATGYTGLAAVSKGAFAGTASSDALLFARGTEIYVLTMDTGIGTWAKTTLAALFKDMPYKPSKVDAMDVLSGSLFGSNQDVFVIFNGAKVYSLTTKTSTVADAATALYPPGSTGTMSKVSKVDSAFIVQNKLGIALTAGSGMQSAVFNATTGALDWKKVVSIKGAFPCDQ